MKSEIYWITFHGPAQHDALITFYYSRAFWFARTLYTTHIQLLKKRNDSFGNNFTQLLNICFKLACPLYNRKGEEWINVNMCHEKSSKTNFWKCSTFIVARRPSYNVWTSAGASSMTVESAATQVSVDQSATNYSTNTISCTHLDIVHSFQYV